MSAEGRYHLFERYGIELEYMLVDAESLDVRPWAERVLVDSAGQVVSDLEVGPVAWSNELVAHVVELKTAQPAPTLTGWGERFQQSIRALSARLAPHGARLLPTAMHPWMDPARETRLWPHDSGEIYAAFDRIFDCRGHGWSNLQSAHLNLPFADDAEFARLHAAIRLVLPLLPALAASSPFCEGRRAPHLDERLAQYRHNCRRLPLVSGRVIPEPAASQADYQARILEPMYRQIAPLDPEGLLQDEYLNARGAIARFGRGTIEIRLLDVQECPAADMAIVHLVTAVLRAQVAERWRDLAAQQAWPVEPLAELFDQTVATGDQARIEDADFLRAWGWPERGPATAADLWRHLAETTAAERGPAAAEFAPALDVILNQGPLARRLLATVGPAPSRPALRDLYQCLATCLTENRPFEKGGRSI